MRWIFILLVGVNAAVGAYALYFKSMSAELSSVVAPKKVVVEGAQRLVLLSELQVVELEEMLASKKRLSVEPQSEEQRLCTLIGPFKELLEAEYFTEKLSALEIEASVENMEVPGEGGFWVFQAAQLSRKAALRRLYEFQAKGIDSYIIPKGELENGISFGVFAQKEEAEKKKREIVAFGFEAEIKSADGSYEEVWVVLQPGEAIKADEELWLELLKPVENAELVQNFCPTIAS
jgi:hypothetical protein